MCPGSTNEKLVLEGVASVVSDLHLAAYQIRYNIFMAPGVLHSRIWSTLHHCLISKLNIQPNFILSIFALFATCVFRGGVFKMPVQVSSFHSPLISVSVCCAELPKLRPRAVSFTQYHQWIGSVSTFSSTKQTQQFHYTRISILNFEPLDVLFSIPKWLLPHRLILLPMTVKRSA